MDDIAELEGRISRALDRIRAGVDLLDAARAAPAADAGDADRDETAQDGADQAAGTQEAELTALRAQLDEERMVNAQLEERVRRLKDRQDGMIAHLEAQASEQRHHLAALDHDLQRLRQANADLSDAGQKLRIAAQGNLAEPHLVNTAMLAELDALRAQREADRAEIEAVLAELRPLAEEAS